MIIVLKDWIGATGKVFGNKWDKGHYIAHTIGGAVDGLEANIFVQRRDLNRGGLLKANFIERWKRTAH